MDKKLYNQKEVKKIARDFVRYLEKDHNLLIEKAYLFGSYAKKTPRKWSDIDVCIISKKFDKVNPLSYLWTRRRDIDIEMGIEPYGLSPTDFVAENPIAHEVKKYGVKV